MSSDVSEREKIMKMCLEVKSRCTPRECVCSFVARDALSLNDWDVEKAVKYLKQKAELGNNFDINEFRRSLK